MKQILSLFITSLALCTACSSPKGSDTVQVAETTTEQTIQKASSAIHYNAFSHNDYWRERPLLDALSFRFNCVEADLWLIDGELYVSHDRPEPNPAITFENLYLKPLVARIQANGGKVYPGSDRPFLPDGGLQGTRRRDVQAIKETDGTLQGIFLFRR